MKQFKIKGYNTMGGDEFDEIFEAETKEKAIQIAKFEFCNPLSSHMCNIKITSCKTIKNHE